MHNFRVMPTVQPLKVENIGLCIERVSTVCVLGVNLQDNLSWSIHVEAIVKRMKQLTFAFRFLSFSYSQQDLKRLFYSVIMPTLLYSCPAWCNLTAGEVKQLQRALAPAARMAGVTVDVRLEMEREVSRLFKSLVSNRNHPLHHLTPIRASHFSARRPRLPSIRANTERLKQHFISLAVRLFNAQN